MRSVWSVYIIPPFSYKKSQVLITSQTPKKSICYNKLMAQYPTPITYMNRKQLTKIARDNNIDYTAETTREELIELIEA